MAVFLHIETSWLYVYDYNVAIYFASCKLSYRLKLLHTSRIRLLICSRFKVVMPSQISLSLKCVDWFSLQCSHHLTYPFVADVVLDKCKEKTSSSCHVSFLSVLTEQQTFRNVHPTLHIRIQVSDSCSKTDTTTALWNLICVSCSTFKCYCITHLKKCWEFSSTIPPNS